MKDLRRNYSYDEHQRRLAREQEAREERAREQTRRNELFAMIDAAKTPEDLLAVLWNRANEYYGDNTELGLWMIFDQSGSHYTSIKYNLDDCLEKVIEQHHIDKSACERCDHYYTRKNCNDCTKVVYSEDDYYRLVRKIAGALAIFWGKVAEAE